MLLNITLQQLLLLAGYSLIPIVPNANPQDSSYLQRHKLLQKYPRRVSTGLTQNSIWQQNIAFSKGHLQEIQGKIQALQQSGPINPRELAQLQEEEKNCAAHLQWLLDRCPKQ